MVLMQGHCLCISFFFLFFFTIFWRQFEGPVCFTFLDITFFISRITSTMVPNDSLTNATWPCFITEFKGPRIICVQFMGCFNIRYCLQIGFFLSYLLKTVAVSSNCIRKCSLSRPKMITKHVIVSQEKRLSCRMCSKRGYGIPSIVHSTCSQGTFWPSSRYIYIYIYIWWDSDSSTVLCTVNVHYRYPILLSQALMQNNFWVWLDHYSTGQFIKTRISKSINHPYNGLFSCADKFKTFSMLLLHP